LQILSEETLRKTGFNFSLVVLLHQTFDQYAKSLSEAKRNEWAKVQGRFESISFIESPEETLKIIGTAIEHNNLNDKEISNIQTISKKVSSIIDNELNFEGEEEKNRYIELFQECYPLHPISSLILPILCQKIAQNERTLFSYLGSNEKYGFRDSNENIKLIGKDWIYPNEIFEYFIHNQQISSNDPIIYRRWNEVLTAIDRLGDVEFEESNLLKTIGLLNIIGAHGFLKSSLEILRVCSKEEKFEKTLKSLEIKSVIQFRKFSSEYRVWQGSDFDINENLNKEREKIGLFNISERINGRYDLLPLVARKYSIENGTLRYFDICFTDSSNINNLDESSQPRIVLYLSNNEEDNSIFHSFKNNSSKKLDFYALCKNKDILRETVAEVWALENIESSYQELNSDPIAQREFKDRYKHAVKLENDLIDSIIDKPELNEWYWNFGKIDINDKREFQKELSRILNKIYKYSPIFKNELINRDKLSSQSNAARTKLMLAMLHHGDQADLGFEKNPPEKTIYRSVLKETGLHSVDKNNKWFFGINSKNKKNISYVWNRINQFLDNTDEEACSFVQLNKELMSPPYGLKEGIISLLYFTVILSRINEIAVYENKVYTPYISDEQVERFLRRPDTFQFQVFKIDGLNKSLFNAYANIFDNQSKEENILSIARPIAKELGKLPNFTKYTNQLSEKTKKIRDAFKISQSPFDLFLIEIPKILELDFRILNDDKKEIGIFTSKFKQVLSELKSCYNELLKEFVSLIITAFDIKKNISLKELREEFLSEYRGLEEFTIDSKEQLPFLNKLNKKNSSDQEWIEELLGFLVTKHPSKWSDDDKTEAEYKLIKISNKLKSLKTLRHHFEINKTNLKQSNFDVYLINGVKKGQDNLSKAVVVREEIKPLINKHINKIFNVIDKIKDNDLKEAIYAELVYEYLKTKEKKDAYREVQAEAKFIKSKGSA